MLADGTIAVQVGALAPTVLPNAGSLSQLINFICRELPRWRDRPERPVAEAEGVLTSQLCAHLNSAARHSGWDFLQFRTEEPDTVEAGRRIDLIAAPSDCAIWVEGRRHVDFDTLLPMECKRLPTPKGPRRDKREYLFCRHTSTGGVDRFKRGLHGAAHQLALMIAFIQEGDVTRWERRIARWTAGLARAGISGWVRSDSLSLENIDAEARCSTLVSRHSRNGLSELELRHLWIEMSIGSPPLGKTLA
ncbi:MAG: hypothetical protein WA047_12620 [Phenylobacterium sp.]|uniref:hypothetical protein n=1 Tax=Phenylobacterium sp. TaxID=1871053 RepID=UPI003BB78597